MVPAISLPGSTTIDVFAENLVAHNQYTVNFDFPTGLNDENPGNVKLYPNPTKGVIYVYGAENAGVSVFNSVGGLVLTKSNFTGTSLDLSSLAKGVYMVRIEKADHNVIQKKIVIM